MKKNQRNELEFQNTYEKKGSMEKKYRAKFH